MDSEHRHELKSNELANILTHFPEFCKKNANVILGLGLIIIALITWPMFTKMSQNKAIAQQSQVSDSIQQLNQSIGMALQGADEQTLGAVLINAQELIDSTAKTDNPNLKALAYIKAAQAYRTELHINKEILSADAIESQVQKAQDAYEKAAQMAKTDSLKGMTQLGLGLCAEERGQTQQAAEIYQAIIDDESLAATVLPKQAQARLDGLQENAESFTFAPSEDELENMTAEELQAAIDAKQTELVETRKMLEEAENAQPAEEDTEN